MGLWTPKDFRPVKLTLFAIKSGEKVHFMSNVAFLIKHAIKNAVLYNTTYITLST